MNTLESDQREERGEADFDSQNLREEGQSSGEEGSQMAEKVDVQEKIHLDFAQRQKTPCFA